MDITKCRGLFRVLGLHKYWRFRKLVGGRWERWWCQSTYCYIWFHYPNSKTVRPAGCFGAPEIEDYTLLSEVRIVLNSKQE